MKQKKSIKVICRFCFLAFSAQIGWFGLHLKASYSILHLTFMIFANVSFVQFCFWSALCFKKRFLMVKWLMRPTDCTHTFKWKRSHQQKEQDRCSCQLLSYSITCQDDLIQIYFTHYFLTLTIVSEINHFLYKIQPLKVNLQLNGGFLFFALSSLMD